MRWSPPGANTNDVAHRTVGVVQGLLNLSGLIWVAAQAHWLAPILLMAGGFVDMRLSWRFGITHYALQRGVTPDVRWVHHLGSLLTRRDTAKEVRLFGLGPHLHERWRAEYDAVRRRLLRYDARQRLGLGLSALAPIVALGGGLALVLGRIDAGGLSLGEVTSALYALLRLQEAWQGFAGIVSQLWTFYLRVMGDLVDFLALAEPRPSGTTLSPGPHSIALEGVGFTYSGSERPALGGVSLVLRPGEKIALVGPNGSGKSTLVHLLLGLYRPTTGTVRIGEHDLRDLDDATLWQQVTAVFQDFVRHPLTVRDNIGFGRVEHIHDDAALARAAEKGGAAEVIAELPERYEAMLGPDFGGRDLSTGQWQKVATARAFMRDEGVALLVLDEPTAALDLKAEVEVYRRSQALAGDRTAILISHRMGFARLADRVIVLKDGHIAESGTHHELLRAGGVYASLFATQAQWYQ